jgi:hypothetical protein
MINKANQPIVNGCSLSLHEVTWDTLRRSNSSEIGSQIEKKHEMALDDKLQASARNIERAPATGLEIDPLI